MDLNKVMLIGRLTKDVEVRATTTGKSVASFSMATNQSYLDKEGQRQEKAEFHNIVAWGKLAEICGQYLTKGKRSYIEGRLQTREWTAQDGTRKFTTEVIADNMIILDPPSGGGGGAPRTPYTPGTGSAPKSTRDSGGEVIEEERTLEDIPF